jgi:hypothetical protein
MAETTADVKRDIELTRDRISNTLNQLEQKVHITQIIKDNPWPAVGLAVGAGFLLSGSSVDVKAAATTVAATKGASSRLGTVLDDMVASLMGGLSAAFEERLESLVGELKGAIGAPTDGSRARTGTSRSNFAAGGASGGLDGGMTVSSAGSQSMHDAGGPASTGMGTGASPAAGSASGGSFGAAAGGSSAGASSTSAAGYQTRAD